MRKVTAGLFISLDGVVESPEKWQFDYFDGDVMANLASYIAMEDTVLMGRVTYELWLPHWPTSKVEPYATHINNTPKYVVSRTLERVDWNNSTLVKEPLAELVARLKQQPGKNIGVAGSPTLVRSLLEDDLLDELTLMIHPVVLGSGKRLLENGSKPKRLELAHSQITGTGVAILTYRPRR